MTLEGLLDVSSTPASRLPLTIVVMTRNRRSELLDVLQRLLALPERPAIVVVDNGSTDGTASAVARIAGIDVIRCGDNLGVEARNVAVRAVTTPYVAFNDDDSWWTPGSLGTVVSLFERHPALGAVAAHVLVEPDGRDDPTSLAMRASPVAATDSIPGRPILGFLACSAAVRRSAFLGVGGFERRLHFGGEEQLLAADLVRAGWAVRYQADITVRHRPSAQRDTRWRQRRDLRNALWFLGLRRPLRVVARRSRMLLGSVPPTVWAPAAGDALLRGAWVLAARRVAPPWLEAQLRAVDAAVGPRRATDG